MDYRTAYKLVNHATAQDDNRPVLAMPHIDAANNVMFAADGFRLVVISLDKKLEPPRYDMLILKGYLVQVAVNPMELYAISRLHYSIKGESAAYILRVNLIEGDSSALAFTQTSYSVHSSLDCTIIDDKRKKNKPVEIRFGISPQYLMDCAKAIKEYLKTIGYDESTKVILSISKPSMPIMFDCKDYREVIMPMFVDWDKPEKSTD